ncbi:hypothetical protein PC128_g6771 [Phytophthora cactorum]|nr:hypothetical protein PC120_g12190 [Phytophthora cactorum]KAG3092557.1 hypothetical protein PC121_g3559 [Phytophthora cactorum]KAG3197499.1 hypothetical protein PC128_g6771 [Phytophthora cactorum]KAG4053681.1 hypothetical protein PC123_g11174 [Phytophthora cactorum]
MVDVVLLLEPVAFHLRHDTEPKALLTRRRAGSSRLK